MYSTFYEIELVADDRSVSRFGVLVDDSALLVDVLWGVMKENRAAVGRVYRSGRLVLEHSRDEVVR